jgi:hypothetical protein
MVHSQESEQEVDESRILLSAGYIEEMVVLHQRSLISPTYSATVDSTRRIRETTTRNREYRGSTEVSRVYIFLATCMV